MLHFVRMLRERSTTGLRSTNFKAPIQSTMMPWLISGDVGGGEFGIF
jgi:hypothetical protein